MAQSPAHRFGQIVGDVLEGSIGRLLQRFAKQHGLYLDMKGERPCRRGKKCSWIDLNKNSHDLDFVLERGGSANNVGMPVAFIETAWRRYTKHSRNKAQEIQGALEPLAETYRHLAPFKGAVLAGVFTEGALTQLRSLGFTFGRWDSQFYTSPTNPSSKHSERSESTPVQRKRHLIRSSSER